MSRRVFRGTDAAKTAWLDVGPANDDAAGPCGECAAAMRWVKRMGVGWRCWGCDTLLEPTDPTLVGAAPRSPERDLDNLERWIPEIEGRSTPFESIYKVEADAAGNKRRQRQLSLETDAPKVAEYMGAVGEALLEPGAHRGFFGGGIGETSREDFMDANSPGWHEAVQTIRRLETLSSAPEGRRHVLVLCAVYLMTGAATRGHWRARGGLGVFVGYLFGETRMRDEWLYDPDRKVATAAARLFGESLLVAATQAYRSLPPEAARAVLNRGRLRLDQIRDGLGRAIATLWSDVYVSDAFHASGRAEAAAKAA